MLTIILVITQTLIEIIILITEMDFIKIPTIIIINLDTNQEYNVLIASVLS
jgi:hypothetical protein